MSQRSETNLKVADSPHIWSMALILPIPLVEHLLVVILQNAYMWQLANPIQRCLIVSYHINAKRLNNNTNMAIHRNTRLITSSRLTIGILGYKVKIIARATKKTNHIFAVSIMLSSSKSNKLWEVNEHFHNSYDIWCACVGASLRKLVRYNRRRICQGSHSDDFTAYHRRKGLPR